MSRRLNRFAPAAPAGAYQTYAIYTPNDSHFRAGTCAEVECPAMVNGWVTEIHEGDQLGQRQAHYIRKESGRSFREERMPNGMTRFTFPAGQKCFRPHRVRLERDPLYVRRMGDWRGNPTGIGPMVHTRAADWVDDFATHQDHIQRIADRG